MPTAGHHKIATHINTGLLQFKTPALAEDLMTQPKGKVSFTNPLFYMFPSNQLSIQTE
jgi:hypothetical protein